MDYQQPINTSNPGLFMILLDQSQSMAEQYDPENTKAEVAAKAVNKLIGKLLLTSTAGSDIKDRCYVAIIGYGREIKLLKEGKISEFEKSFLRTEWEEDVNEETGAFGQIEQGIWIEPKHENGTPMAETMEAAYGYIKGWCKAHLESFPPIVINITDGAPNDMIPPGDGSRTRAAAENLKSLRTNDGNLLLFNAHISKSGENEVALPTIDSDLNGYGKFLFQISSQLPDKLVEQAKKNHLDADYGSRGLVYNVSPKTLIKFLAFGTQ